MGASTSKQTRDINIGALPPLGAPPAKLDLLGGADVSDNNKIKSFTAAQLMRVIDDASVSNNAAPSGTHRIPISDGSDIGYVNWSQISTLGSTPQIAPLNHTGRLSAISNVANPTIDAFGATSIYLVPDTNGPGIMALYNGSSWDQRSFVAQVTLSLSGVTAGFYDVYVYYTGSALALELVAWTNTYQKRATVVALQDGVGVKTGSTGRRLVGFINVYATGLVNQTKCCADNGLVSIQDMPRFEYEHSFYGEHSGWMAPWMVVPMMRVAQARGGYAPRLQIQYDGSSQSSFTNPVAAGGWCFRRPNKFHTVKDNSSSGKMTSGGLSDMWAFRTSWAGTNTTPDVAVPNSGNTGGCTRRFPYDPVGDKFYMFASAVSQVYKWDPVAHTFSTPAGLNKNVASNWKLGGDYVPSNRKIYCSDQTNLYAIDTSADTFGSSIVAESSDNGYRGCWHPISNKWFFRASSSTVKVLDCTNNTVVATVTLSANNYFGSSGDIGDCVYCPTTELVYVFGYGSGDSLSYWGRAVALDKDGNIVRVIQISKLFQVQHADYIPGWDCFLVWGNAQNSGDGTNDSNGARVMTLSPHVVSSDPGTSYSAQIVGGMGSGNQTPLSFLSGSTPAGLYYYRNAPGGLWLPHGNQVFHWGGQNASASTLYSYRLSALW